MRVNGSGGDPRQQLDRQALALWLNFADGGVDWDELVDVNGDLLPDAPLGEVLEDAEDVRLDAAATREQLEAQKDILERINVRDG